MAKRYKFTAVTPDGAVITGVESAADSSVLRRALLARDLHPTEVTEKKSVLQFEITKKKVARKELMHFSRQIAVFLRAGIPVLEALEVISDETNDKLFKLALVDMTEGLRAGDTFWMAASAHPEVFPPFYLSILRSAELTGNLDTVLDQLSEYIERDLEARRKITSALVYPAVVMVMSIIPVVILTTFVLPRFKTFFKNLDAKLPLPTRMLLSVSNFLSNWWFIFAGLAFVIVVFLLVSLQSERGRAIRDAILLKTPVVGDVVVTAVLER